MVYERYLDNYVLRRGLVKGLIAQPPRNHFTPQSGEPRPNEDKGGAPYSPYGTNLGSQIERDQIASIYRLSALPRRSPARICDQEDREFVSHFNYTLTQTVSNLSAIKSGMNPNYPIW